MNAEELESRIATGQRVGDCRFDDANIEGMDCSGAVIRMCGFDRARGAGVRFDNARLEDSSAKSADFSGASLRNAKLSETTFERALLKQAVLDGASGEGTCFRGADLSGASFVGARFGDADFRGSDLSGADLSHGRFHSADFRGAILDGARFDGADCTGALFDQGAQPQPHTAANSSDKPSGPPPELQSMLDAFLKQPEALGMLSHNQHSIGDLLGGAQKIVDSLSAADEQPPEELIQLLEQLRQTARSESPDIQSLLATLSSLAQRHSTPGDSR